jgi:protein-disulfide isomerase
MYFRRTPLFLMVAVLLCLIGASACSSADSGTASTKKDSSKDSSHPASTQGVNAATIDGQPIPLSQVDERVARQLYEARQQALEEILNDTLLQKEAKAQGISTDELVKKEVTSKVPDPSQAEIDQVWETNKARLPGKTKDQVSSDIVNYLKQQKSQTVQQTYMQSLRSKYKVQVLLEPPRVKIAIENEPTQGPGNAPVTMVEFSDFQCPYCSRAESTVKQILEKYKGKIKFVYRDFPLSSIHPFAAKAAEAGQCAKEQGKFWEFHDALYSDQTKLAVSDMEATAGRLGLDQEKFKSCLENGKYTADVKKDVDDGQKVGVNSTPSFFINGVAVVGAQGPDAFSAIIDQELSKAGK